jgi:hypothetical protein
MANTPTYNVTLPGSPDVKGTITFQTMGPKYRATINISGTTAGGFTIPLSYSQLNSDGNMGFTGGYSFNDDFDNLAQEIIYNVGDNVTNGEGMLKKTLDPPPPVDESDNTPIYLYQADKSDVKGKVYFEIREGSIGTLGEIYNYPDNGDYVKSSTFGLPSTTSNDYPSLANSILTNHLNPHLAEITDVNGVEGGFGQLVLIETKSESAQEFIDYEMVGKVINENNEPIGDAFITDDVTGVGLTGNNTNSEPTGDFILQGEYVIGTKFSIEVSAEGYGTKSNIIPFNGPPDNIIKDDLGPIKLLSIKNSLEEDELKAQETTEEQDKKIKDFNKKDFITSLVSKLIDNIKKRVIPQILTMISNFGISKLDELKNKSKDALKEKCQCPEGIEGLKKLIDKKNKLTKQLNNLQKSLNLISKTLEIPPAIIAKTAPIITAAKAAVAYASFIPSTVSTPNAVGPILIAKDAIKDLEGIISEMEGKMTPGTFQLGFLLDEFNNVLNMLGVLDNLIQGCAEELGLNGELGELGLIGEEVSGILLESTQDQSQQLSPVVTNINGFKMSVISVGGETDESLKQRRAVARNSQGIIMLQGEPSFSSNDQILIDELVFYIKQNDLKA